MTRASTILAAVLMLFAMGCRAEQNFLSALEGRSFPEDSARLALVIWAENYKHMSKVTNAESDGNRIAQELHKLRFDFVRVVPDADSASTIRDGVKELKAQIAAATKPVVVVLFFAGHGFQVDGENYLVPISASNGSVSELIEKSIRLTDISRSLNPGRRAGLVVLMLDACRTIRFLEDGKLREVAIRSDIPPGFHEGRLLAPAIVSMAAEPGRAARSAGRFEPKNSPYTNSVASRLNAVGLSLTRFLTELESQVLQDTDEAQRPMSFNDRAGEKFFFTPDEHARQRDRLAWQVVLASSPGNLRGCLIDYLKKYPTGRYASQAEYLMSLVHKPGEHCTVD